MAKKNKLIIISVINLVTYYLIVYLVSIFYKTEYAISYGMLIQNLTYFLFAIMSIVSMKLTKISLKSYGLYFENYIKQIFIGIILGVLRILICCIWGLVPSFPSNFIYTLLIQIFVIALSEELFWRGLIQECFSKILNSEVIAVIMSAVLFGVSHFFVSNNFAQVISGFVFGFIMGELRREFKNSIGLITLIIGHAIFNTF